MLLTIYIPTYKRDSLDDCLNSIIYQSNSDIEIIVSDNDQDGYAKDIAYKYKNYVSDYSIRKQNIGCDGNCLHGITAGSGDYVWVIGDDDVCVCVRACVCVCVCVAKRAGSTARVGQGETPRF